MKTRPARLSLVGFCALATVAAPAPLRADLDAYLQKREPNFAWTVTSDTRSDAGRIVQMALTSQTWRGIDWKHQLRVYTPAELKYPNLVLLFITGGSATSQVKPDDHALGFALAKACGGRVAVLPQVPNQPLFGKTEDDLIGETFVNYMNTQEADWPLLFPMVKSAVKAMDAVEQWATKEGAPVEGFVVTGASKRGWTTWLTAAVDKRVRAIAPMVIPTLNMKAQALHQKEAWGYYSEQIEDYTRRGLTEKFDDPVGRVLWKMVDPWSYLDRIKVPVLQINGTNDRYWTLDSMNVFWDDIKAPKYVVYLPNAGHDLKPNREWATGAVGALFRHVASGRPLPALEWAYDNANGNGVELRINSTPQPSEVRLWVAEAANQDFRMAAWSDLEKLGSSSKLALSVRPDASATRAFYADCTYDIDGLTYHLSTQIRIVPPESKR